MAKASFPERCQSRVKIIDGKLPCKKRTLAKKAQIITKKIKFITVFFALWKTEFPILLRTHKINKITREKSGIKWGKSSVKEQFLRMFELCWMVKLCYVGYMNTCTLCGCFYQKPSTKSFNESQSTDY